MSRCLCHTVSWHTSHASLPPRRTAPPPAPRGSGSRGRGAVTVTAASPAENTRSWAAPTNKPVSDVYLWPNWLKYFWLPRHPTSCLHLNFWLSTSTSCLIPTNPLIYVHWASALCDFRYENIQNLSIYLSIAPQFLHWWNYSNIRSLWNTTTFSQGEADFFEYCLYQRWKHSFNHNFTLQYSNRMKWPH